MPILDSVTDGIAIWLWQDTIIHPLNLNHPPSHGPNHHYRQSVRYIIKLTSMNSAYSLSRHDLLQWINTLLSTNLTKIEQLGSGSVYCHILDAAYPEKVALSKVKWNAYLEVDFLHNFKVLQTAFQKLGISKSIETQKLVKAKYQDNLQFIQWMKWFFEPLIRENQPYDALERRDHNQIYLLFTDKKPETRKQHIKNNAQNKQNAPAISTAKSAANLLKSCKSVESLKKMPFKEQSMRKAFEIGQSLQSLLEQKEGNQANLQVKKSKKLKIEVTLKSSLALHERPINGQTATADQECF